MAVRVTALTQLSARQPVDTSLVTPGVCTSECHFSSFPYNDIVCYRDDMLRVFCENHMSTFRPEKAQPAANSSLAAAKERFYASGSTSASSIHEQTGSGAQHSPRVCTFSAPKQVVVPANTPLADIVTKLSAAGVQFPVISKPIASDGTDGSHALTLFLSSQALQVCLLAWCATLPVLESYILPPTTSTSLKSLYFVLPTCIFVGCQQWHRHSNRSRSTSPLGFSPQMVLSEYGT